MAGSGEGSSGLTVNFSLCPPQWKGARELCGVILLISALTPFMGGTPMMLVAPIDSSFSCHHVRSST